MPAKAWILIVVSSLIIVAGAVLLILIPSPVAAPTQPSTTDTIQAHFACSGQKSIDAKFVNASSTSREGNSVHITLSDGRAMTLPQAISASGARYAKADQSIVFWNKGNTAFVTENGSTTFDNCVSQS